MSRLYSLYPGHHPQLHLPRRALARLPPGSSSSYLSPHPPSPHPRTKSHLLYLTARLDVGPTRIVSLSIRRLYTSSKVARSIYANVLGTVSTVKYSNHRARRPARQYPRRLRSRCLRAHAHRYSGAIIVGSLPGIPLGLILAPALGPARINLSRKGEHSKGIALLLRILREMQRVCGEEDP